ncbi:MAG: hypothetical protein NTV23_02460 [Propionibacteriales bacterium]|nr:hypothetical protein [Propionibacteriales bacterium]
MRFELRHDVVVARPIDEVFSALALPEHLERVIRLSPMATRFELLGTRSGPTPATMIARFEFGERVRMLGGLYTAEFAMRGEQTVDSEAKQVDYRTSSTGGAQIRVHKVRTFAQCAEGTRVSEVVSGDAAPGLHWIARRSARAAHVDHMSRYPDLFEKPAW